jgi:RimJ/RimL family protein N-acetyltransferase
MDCNEFKRTIDFRSVDESDLDLIIKLYESRDERQNHQPRTYEEQKKFVDLWVNNKEKHIYQYWYVICYDGKSIGTITTKKEENEWGIWILEEFRDKGLGVLAGTEFFKRHKKNQYCVYIFGYNKRSMKMCEKFGFVLESINDNKYKFIKK